MNKVLITTVIAGLVIAGGYWMYTKKQDNAQVVKIKTASGLEYEVISPANSDAPQCKSGDVVTVHYTGWLNDDGQPGAMFDSSHKRNQPFQFIVGYGMVIPGWEEAIMDMKVGEKRRVYIPARLGYGAQGAGAAIPPHADLIFDIDIVNTQSR
jgi:FKBP-type peptidyl-prolyl cis-trans isomerase